MTKLNSFHLSGKPLDHNKYLYSDEQLISRFQAGDENAYVELVNRFKDKLTNFVYYFTKDEELSEDIVQDAFIKLYEKKHYYKPVAKFSTWLYTIARNLANTELRKKNRAKVIYLSQMKYDKKNHDLESKEQSLISKIENEYLSDELHSAIHRLSDNYKTAIILRDIQGLNYEEISNIVGVPLGTIKSRINRARLQLQVYLKKFKKEL